jgi:hypothetical protein
MTRLRGVRSPLELMFVKKNFEKSLIIVGGLDRCWVLRKIGDGVHYAHQYKEGALVHNTMANLRS